MPVRPSRRRSDTVLAVVLAALWLGASGAMTAARIGPRAALDPVGQLAGVAFLLVLIAWLWRTWDAAESLGAGAPIALARFGYGPTLAAIAGVLLLLFGISYAAHPQLVLVTALTGAAGWLIARHRGAVSRRSVVIGLGLAGLCLALSAASGRVDPYHAYYLVCIPVLFVGGTLLTASTGLAQVHSADGAWGKAAVGVLGGCLLALPAALLNASYGAHPGDGWVDRAWEPAVALVPGIAEETWARLFLLTLLYGMLQPARRVRSDKALLAAVLIAAFVHALAHFPAEMVFSPAAAQAALTALLFGVPMGLIFVRFGFEWAVGYHFFIDFVRFCVALLAP